MHRLRENPWVWEFGDFLSWPFSWFGLSIDDQRFGFEAIFHARRVNKQRCSTTIPWQVWRFFGGSKLVQSFRRWDPVARPFTAEAQNGGMGVRAHECISDAPILSHSQSRLLHAI